MTSMDASRVVTTSQEKKRARVTREMVMTMTHPDVTHDCIDFPGINDGGRAAQGDVVDRSMVRSPHLLHKCFFTSGYERNKQAQVVPAAL